MYTIRIYYSTGDSFSTRDTSNVLGFEWESLEMAKKAIQAIKIHHNYFSNLSYRDRDKKLSKDEIKSLPYCIDIWKDGLDKGKANEFSVVVYGDDGELHKVGAFWMGYFEHIQSAEIETVDDGTTRVEF